MRKKRALAGGLLLAILFAVASLWWTRVPSPVRVGPAALSAEARVADELPRIDLGRLEESRAEIPLGRRNIFEFRIPPPPPPPPTSSPPTLASGATPPTTLAVGAVGPLKVTYIGSIEDRMGLKVAVLLSEKQEVLTAQAGDVVAGQLRIVRIGIESIDVQDTTTDRVRRIPLKAN